MRVDYVQTHLRYVVVGRYGRKYYLLNLHTFRKWQYTYKYLYFLLREKTLWNDKANRLNLYRSTFITIFNTSSDCSKGDN